MAVLYVDNNQGGELVNSKPKKTNKPTGLSVKRSGNKFALTWKNAEKYELLAFWYRTKGQSSWRAWQTLTGSGELIPPGSTGKAITIDSSKFYPNKSGTITAIEFKLKALGKYYETGKGEKRQGWYRTWSDSATKQVTINIPASPSVSGALSDEASNECTFSWSVKTDNANSQMFSDIQWETMLVANCSETDGNKLKWSSSARGYAKGTGGASGSRKVIDDTVAVASGTNTRWFRVRARGKAGATAWKYAKHVYALPLQAKDVRASATITDAGGFQCYLTWTADGKVSRPIDRSTVQWSISVPDVNMSCPNGASWTDGNVSRDTGGRDAAVFSIDDVLSEDQCLFVRVNTHHDTYVTYGLPVLASVGQLKKPTGLTVNINEETHKATVTATNNSEVEDSFLVVKYQTESGVDLDVGIIPFGDDHVTVTCPDWSTEKSIAFGVYAVVGRYQKVERPDDADAYSVAPTMQSEMVWRGGDVPTAPTNVMAQVTQTVGTVRLTWDWSWEGANGAEISWADHEDAWESTDEPETYIISNLHASRWNIAGLDTGKRWYFRVRLMNGDGDDETTYSPYSELTPNTWIDLTAAPTIPTLTLGDGSQGIITETGNINASWVYVSNDGTSQIYAEICDIADLSQIDLEYIASTDENVRLWKRYFTRSGSGTEQDPYEYTEVENPEGSPSSLGWYELNRAIIAHTETAQHVLLDALTYGWRAGEVHQLAVRVKSASGVVSDGWSDSVPLMIATPIEAVIASTSLVSKTVEIDSEAAYTANALTEMPLTVTVTGAGENGITFVAVERAEAYVSERPDEDMFNGFEGETIAIASHVGEDEFVFEISDLIGRLDDGAKYKIVATIQDDIGQKSETELPFEVMWDEQAIRPTATAEVDEDNYAVKIAIGTPSGAGEGAVCDVYRLSADRPELIYTDAPLGSIIVDPYPAIGPRGGHRIVYKTVNGDYITSDYEMAWIDLQEDENDTINIDMAVINFEGGQILLEYNLDASHSWSKDFKETKYLGGSIQGDWNPAVSRTLSLSATAISFVDADKILMMRRLADTPSICHVRTPDGSSFSADVQVSESTSTSTGGVIYKYSLTITRVDPESPDGMTLADWQRIHGE